MVGIVLQPILQVPRPPDFDVAVPSNSQTVTAGGAATFTVIITAVNGFNGVVTPSQTGFPLFPLPFAVGTHQRCPANGTFNRLVMTGGFAGLENIAVPNQP